MPFTVREVKKFLNQFDDDAIVSCIVKQGDICNIDDMVAINGKAIIVPVDIVRIYRAKRKRR